MSLFGFDLWSNHNVYNYDEKDAITNIAQQYSGTCDITCNNHLSNADLSFINSTVGPIDITQSCDINTQCLYNTNMNATADVIFKGKNTAAVDGGCGSGLISIAGICDDTVKNISRYYIQTNVDQSINQKCDIGTQNDIDNVTLTAVNSKLDGIYIGQSGKITGNCTMGANMDALVQVTASTDNCAAAGKKAVKACSGKMGKSYGEIILFAGGALVAMVILSMLTRIILPSNKGNGK